MLPRPRYAHKPMTNPLSTSTISSTTTTTSSSSNSTTLSLKTITLPVMLRVSRLLCLHASPLDTSPTGPFPSRHSSHNSNKLIFRCPKLIMHCSKMSTTCWKKIKDEYMMYPTPPGTWPRGDLTAQASLDQVGHVFKRQAGLNRETDRQKTNIHYYYYYSTTRPQRPGGTPREIPRYIILYRYMYRYNAFQLIECFHYEKVTTPNWRFIIWETQTSGKFKDHAPRPALVSCCMLHKTWKTEEIGTDSVHGLQIVSPLSHHRLSRLPSWRLSPLASLHPATLLRVAAASETLNTNVQT